MVVFGYRLQRNERTHNKLKIITYNQQKAKKFVEMHL